MSRMGKVPIVPPKGINVTFDDGNVTVKGPKGELSLKYSDLVNLRKEKDEIWVDRVNDDRNSKAQQGLVHRMMSNMITGVGEGFKKQLEIVGVGYRAAVEGKNLVLTLGYSHPVNYGIPEDIKISVDKNTVIIVEGIDKQRVGQVAAEIRAWRKPDSYKGKGIRYAGEHVRLKPGKAAVGSGF